jgi:hypothetical protein
MDKLGRLAALSAIVGCVTGCASSGATNVASSEFLALYLEQQRLRQSLFLKQLGSYRIVQCLPEGFVFVCR